MKESGINKSNTGEQSRWKHSSPGWNQKGKQPQRKPYSRPSGNNRDQQPYRPIASVVGGGQVNRQPQDYVRKFFKCGSPDHLANVCLVRGLICYQCGKPEHMAKDCPQQGTKPKMNNVKASRPTVKGRVYTLNGGEASQSEDLIQGSCDMSGNLLIVLFDSGATHSFISMDRVKQLNLPTTSLPFDLIVSTPTAEPICVCSFCQNCPIVIQDKKFLVNLICLPLTQLDVILGMDWLSSNHILLDCARKVLIFHTHEVSGFKSTHQEQTSFKEGVLGYMLLSSLEIESEQMLDHVPIVQDFPDVFPEDVPGLPPTRDIEFSIDLVPGSGPISIPPYRMAPTELAELKMQLEDLLSK
jgi:hypothetical protein